MEPDTNYIIEKTKQVSIDLDEISKEEIIAFINCDIKLFNDIIQAIITKKTFITTSIESYLNEKKVAFNSETIDFMLKTIESILGFHVFDKIEIEKILNDFTIVIEIIQLNNKNEIEFTFEELNGKMQRVLSIDTEIGFSNIFKKDYISLEKENVFSNIETFVDLRPVFNDNRTEIIDEVILVDLKIENQNDSIFISLLEDDIDIVLNEILKAKQKVETIKAHYGS